MKLSLIQTSINRKEELSRFIDSLDSQINIDYSNIEYIFIDQGDNEDIFKKLNTAVKFIYIRIEPGSLSKARNIGIEHASGDIICFPDDDCWYPSDTLWRIIKKIDSNKYDGLVIKATSESGIPLNVYPPQSRYIGLFDHCGASSICIFLKLDKKILFDENIGVGTKYGLLSGEETDYLIQYYRKHPKIYYEKNIIVYHPINKVDYFDNEIKKVYYYGRGYGYLLKKHKYPLKYILKAFLRPLCGMIIYMLQLKFKYAKRSMNILKGRIDGYNFNLHV